MALTVALVRQLDIAAMALTVALVRQLDIAGALYASLSC